jgi:sulfonate transport system substrate-binding protein
MKSPALLAGAPSTRAPAFDLPPLSARAAIGIIALVVLAFFTWYASPASAADTKTVRIGYQKYGTLVILKARGTLEKRLAAEGVDVKWTEFPAGPQLLEGLNVGSIDFGTVGEAPPIFAQAAGADLIYVAHEPPSPAAEAIVVPKDSALRGVADLKGKKVALNKGSNVHYLLVKVLEANGLKYTDIEPVFLAPADARAAFERGSVDAWAIWDPFLAAAQKQISARVLADGTGVVKNHQFYLASRTFAQQNPALVHAVLDELAKIDAWGAQNPGEVAAFLAPAIGLDRDTVELAIRRYSFGIVPVGDAVLGEQQKIADVFTDLKLIPKRLVVRDATPPASFAAERAPRVSSTSVAPVAVR